MPVSFLAEHSYAGTSGSKELTSGRLGSLSVGALTVFIGTFGSVPGRSANSLRVK